MILFYGKIGTMSNGSVYYFNVPYCASKKFIDYISGEKDGIGKQWFGYDRDKIVDTMYAVQFHICEREGYDPETYKERREYNIHYHMLSREGYEECYNPTLGDENKKELVFLSIEDACKFLIKFMEEYEITEVNIEEAMKDINGSLKEIRWQTVVVNRITEALNYK
jgi:hypothetical protein